MNGTTGNYTNYAACYWSLNHADQTTVAAVDAGGMSSTTTVFKADRIQLERGINDNTRCPYDIVQIGGSEWNIVVFWWLMLAIDLF